MKVWNLHQAELLSSVQDNLILGGDGRCDSPGHTAKYGTYTLMDLQLKKILHIQLVQVIAMIFELSDPALILATGV